MNIHAHPIYMRDGRKKCKLILRDRIPIIRNKKLNEIFQKHLVFNYPITSISLMKILNAGETLSYSVSILKIVFWINNSV